MPKVDVAACAAPTIKQTAPRVEISVLMTIPHYQMCVQRAAISTLGQQGRAAPPFASGKMQEDWWGNLARAGLPERERLAGLGHIVNAQDLRALGHACEGHRERARHARVA